MFCTIRNIDILIHILQKLPQMFKLKNLKKKKKTCKTLYRKSDKHSKRRHVKNNSNLLWKNLDKKKCYVIFSFYLSMALWTWNRCSAISPWYPNILNEIGIENKIHCRERYNCGCLREKKKSPFNLTTHTDCTLKVLFYNVCIQIKHKRKIEEIKEKKSIEREILSVIERKKERGRKRER